MTPAVAINKYLKAKGSPLAGKGAVFVREGRKNGIDPMLLVAIAGAESDFGKYGPTAKIHNPFGWGPHIKFATWDQAISTVARGLRKGYLDEGRKTISAIGEKWAPQGASNDPTNLNSNWARNVGRFYSELGGQGVASKAAAPSGAQTPGLPPSFPAAPALPDPTSAVLGSLSEIGQGRKPDPLRSLTDLTMGVAGQAVDPASIPNFGGLAPTAPAPVEQAPARAPAVSGFVPAFEAALNKLLKATGLTVNSGYRSNERQAELFAAAVKKYGSEAAARKWVAPPGRSKHNHGVAADLGGNLSVLNDSLLRKYGLYRPLAYEPWHVELIGSRG